VNPLWEYASFDATQGPQHIVDFLNEPDRQWLDEAFVVASYPGSVGLFFKAPGAAFSTWAWNYRIFSADEGPQGAVDFMNGFLWYPSSQAFAIASGDGSISLFYITPVVPDPPDPGPLPMWSYRNFTADDGLAGAVGFLNEYPVQWPNETFVVAGNVDSVGLFFRAPPSGPPFGPGWRFKYFTADEGTQGAVDFLNQDFPWAPTAFARNDGSMGILYAVNHS
jgi:hypothetical protein